MSRTLCGVAALMFVAACGDPNSVGSSPTAVEESAGDTTLTTVLSTPATAAGGVDMHGIAVCTDPPFGGSQAPPEELGSQASSWAATRPDLFAGMWWDASAGQFVFDTIDVDQASTVIAQELPTDLVYRIEPVARSATQLTELQQRAGALAAYGIQFGSGQRVWDASLEIDLPILDQPSIDAVQRVFDGDLGAICVTGADPATVPPDGPQPTSGDGWRLLADQTRRGEAYSVHVAVNAVEYESLWASLGLDGSPVPVDFGTEIVVHFGAVYSGSCPEIRLDDVNVDLDRSTVTADVVQLGGNRECTADANQRAYVVAIDKAHLPPVPFTVSLQADCSYCAHHEVTTLDGTAAPPATLSEYDRSQIFAAAVVARVEFDTPAVDSVDIVETVGQATADGFIQGDGGTPMTEADRNTIRQALGARTVRFVPAPTDETLVPTPGYAVVTVAEPVVIDGKLTVTSSLWCADLCGTGGAIGVERHDDGTWTATGPVGPQWEA